MQLDVKYHIVIVEEGIGEVVFGDASQDEEAELGTAHVLLH